MKIATALSQINKVAIFVFLTSLAVSLCVIYWYYTIITKGQTLFSAILAETPEEVNPPNNETVAQYQDPAQTTKSLPPTDLDLINIITTVPPTTNALTTEISTHGTTKNSPATAAPLPSRTFWNSDLHDGTRIDAPSILHYLGQKLIINGVKGSSGPYPEVLKQFSIPGGLSPTIMSHVTHTDYMSEQDIRSNFEFYKNNVFIAETDAFMCSFPPSFCEMWMPFNKSIVFYAAHRFSLGRCTKARLERLIQHIYEMNNSTSPKHFIAASGVYDVEYINYYTGLKPMLLGTSSFFYAGHGVTNYTQARKEILIGPLQHSGHPQMDELKAASVRKSKKEQWTFSTAKQLYGWYSLQNVANHRAVVVLPYAVMSYGLTEIYAMAIPMLVPSIDMLVKYAWTGDRSLIDGFYCGQQMAAQLPPKHPDSRHPYSPDTYEAKAFGYWLQFADFFQWPHVTVFNDWDDLIDKLESMDFEAIHQKMVLENQRREVELLDGWRKIIAQIDKGRKVPDDYNQAIRALWNTDALQVA